METIQDILMRRDSISQSEADELVADAKIALREYLEYDDQEAAYEVCSEFFGLEPDFLVQLID